MTNTLNISAGLGSGGTSNPARIAHGQYFVAVSGSFSGAASLQLYANVGAASATPVTDAVFTEAGVKVVWLPSCTIYGVVTNGDGSTSINIAVARLTQTIED